MHHIRYDAFFSCYIAWRRGGIIIKKLGYSEIRAVVKKRFCSICGITDANEIDNITIYNIEELLRLYDSMILDGYIEKNIRGGIKVSLSSRMTRSGGKTIYTKAGGKKYFEVRISTNVLQKYLEDGKLKKVCGIDALDMVDALMLIVEHEICHIIEFNAFGVSNCKGRRFKEMAAKVFGHTSSYHEILKGYHEKKPSMNNFKCGHRVYFKYKNNIYHGVISNINKRATVMVENENGAYSDERGVRYEKWYVPLNALMKGDIDND